MDADWKREDLFHLDTAAEHRCKIWVAGKLSVHYAACLSNKPFAQVTNGVAPYDEEVVQAALDAIHAVHNNDTLTTAEKDAAAKSKGTLATVLNGCQVSWQAWLPHPFTQIPPLVGVGESNRCPFWRAGVLPV